MLSSYQPGPGFDELVEPDGRPRPTPSNTAVRRKTEGAW